jgi:hypothetical protein
MTLTSNINGIGVPLFYSENYMYVYKLNRKKTITLSFILVSNWHTIPIEEYEHIDTSREKKKNDEGRREI